MNPKNSPSSQSPQVFIVEASAGSGKTYALANHYLKLLFQTQSTPRQIENILAVTFTNKAAREMKERILELLKKIALDKFRSPEEEHAILENLKIDKKKAQEKARALMDYIIANYNFFQVKTIDSFINMILLGCAYRIGLSANFKIKDQLRSYLSYSLDQCIDKANHDNAVKKLFDAFLHQYIYLEEKSSWLPKPDMLSIMFSLFYQANMYGSEFEKFDPGDESIFRQKQALLRRIESFSKNIPPELHGTFRNTITRFVQNHGENFDFSEIANSKSLLAEKLPVTGKGSVPLEAKELWDKISREIRELAFKEAKSLFNCYIDIFNLIYEVFRKRASQDDVVFLEELNQQARSLINENGITVPERYYWIAMRLKHFLIDEFQDTSVLQWQNLSPMIAETLSTGGSLFYVGDKKQAIFRFRGGEASLFDSIKDDFSAYLVQSVLKLNHRSQKEIVEFNNKVFSQENLRGFFSTIELNNELKQFNAEDIDDILAVFSAHSQEYVQDSMHEYGFVQVEPFQLPGGGEEEEMIREKLLCLLGQLRDERRFSLKDIAVLCRGNADVELVSGWLIEQNIAVESEKTLNIKNNQRIKELIALFNFLNSPIDNLSFASFILGELFLRASGLTRLQMQDFLFEIKDKTRKEQGFYIYLEFKKRYSHIWQLYFEDFYKTIGFIGLYELSVDIFRKFKALRNFPGEQGFFMHFLQLIKDSEEEHQGVSDFLDYFEELQDEKLYVNSSDVEAIKVMTIHKAKGLGFGVVIIPFLELNLNHLNATDTYMNVSYAVENSQNRLSLLRLDRKYALLSSAIRKTYRQEFKKKFIDELNTIYVAFTRAKFELYIFIPQTGDKLNNSIKFLIPQEYFQRGAKHLYKQEPARDASSLVISPPEYKEWLGFLKEEFVDIAGIKNRRHILRGKVLHEILSCFGDLSRTDKETALEEGFVVASIEYPFISDFSEIDSIIRKVLESEDTRRFFYLDGKEVYQEKEIVDRSGDTKRIDRLIISQDAVWIVDYKTKGESASEYKEQISAYMEIAKDLYPGKEIKGYVMFLEDCRVEELDG